MSEPTSYTFDSEISSLLSLIINSIYRDSSVFVRELISNCSDALDKANHQALKDVDYLGEEGLKIEITPVPEKMQLVISDTGIGMTRQDLIDNLGCIAHSGTRSFLHSIEQTDNTDALSTLIGQFGVGFYSSFLVAHTVTVFSKSNDEDVVHKWESSAGDSFSIEVVDMPELKRGTRIVLHLKDEHKEFLEEEEIVKLIEKHSQFINHPIYLYKKKEREVPVVEEAKVEETEESEEPKVEVVGEEEEEEKKTVTEEFFEFDRLNTQPALWTIPKGDITDEQYIEFYKSIAGNDYEEPLAWEHFSIESADVQFKGLIYIPKRAPMSMFDRNKKLSNIRLYLRRVFITDDASEYCPEWLSFVRGVIDAEDLPLNVSRETLQKNVVTRVIRKNIIRKTVALFKKVMNDEEKAKDFYDNFGTYIKLGINDDEKSRKKLAEFLRYHSTKSGDERVSLAEYVDGMKENQEQIYFIAGENKEVLMKSPFVERLVSKGYEVLLMTEPIDEYAVQQLTEYKEKKFANISKDNVELSLDDEEQESLKTLEEEYSTFCEKIKAILGDKKITKAKISFQLEESPCALVAEEFGWSANMSRVMKNQALGQQNNVFGMMGERRVMLINPQNKTIKSLKQTFDADSESAHVRNIVEILFNTAMITSGYDIEDPQDFSKRLYKILNFVVSDDIEEEDEEIPVLEEPGVEPVDDSMEEVD
ncbi:hypothetical protein PCE1_002080 [Barthelona sp. PCE]